MTENAEVSTKLELIRQVLVTAMFAVNVSVVEGLATISLAK